MKICGGWDSHQPGFIRSASTQKMKVNIGIMIPTYATSCSSLASWYFLKMAIIIQHYGLYALSVEAPAILILVRVQIHGPWRMLPTMNACPRTDTPTKRKLNSRTLKRISVQYCYAASFMQNLRCWLTSFQSQPFLSSVVYDPSPSSTHQEEPAPIAG